MIIFFVVLIFLLGYILIALEHSIHINKAAPALIMAVACWLFYFLENHSPEASYELLLHHLGEISSILFFLLGAMTIVEMIDIHGGFNAITNRISTNNKSTLLLIISVLTFFLSALLDNLTTAIVMVSLCSRLLTDRNDKMLFAGMIIIAANSGGAWSPIGDVTTTMLWIGNQITAVNVVKMVILPSIMVCLIPTLLLMWKFKGTTFERKNARDTANTLEGKVVLALGLILLIFVPVFKALTHMPPFMGMLFSLGVMWVATSLLHFKKRPEIKQRYSVAFALQKIDSPGILFFLGILLTVAALQEFHILEAMAGFMATHLQNEFLIGTMLGLLSAIVDNVPLVAAAQGMYDLSVYPTDHYFWEFLALTTGTGGSTIIIGSAAGVAVMGIQNINFTWYMKRISLLAFVGFVAGILTFILQHYLVY